MLSINGGGQRFGNGGGRHGDFMAVLNAFLKKVLPVHDSKFMLFINNRKAKALVFHSIRENTVGTNQNADVAVFDCCTYFFLFGCFCFAG